MLIEVTKNGKTLKIDYELYDELAAEECIDSMAEEWGWDAVKRLAVAQAKADVQNTIRRMIDEDKTQKDVDKFFDEWMPRQAKARKSELEKFADYLSTLDPEQRAALITEADKRAAEKEA